MVETTGRPIDSDAAFAEFRRLLTYKARTGARLHVIDRWYPSSKTCSNCGTVKAKLPCPSASTIAASAA
ncbi:MAG: zinc ribbon domain-containing protein [Bifidobacterium pseudocatenulatum]